VTAPTPSPEAIEAALRSHLGYDPSERGDDEGDLDLMRQTTRDAISAAYAVDMTPLQAELAEVREKYRQLRLETATKFPNDGRPRA
jgi:hypothetical protein